MKRPPFVLVTPVRDEAATVGRAIESVLAQTALPREWSIVSDGSTDETNEIVGRYARRHPWIRLLEMPARAERSFAAVVHCTELGVRHLRSRHYDYLGLLDADLALPADYFEALIRRFEANPRLGLAGGLVVDPGMPTRPPRNRRDVPGAVQFYRRACFESLGGLYAIPEGGWDAVSCAVARMHGFQTELVVELVVAHLKPRNVSQGGPVRRKWQMGVRDYATGYHPVFELLKCLARVLDPPVLVGSLAWWLGYCTAALRGRPRVIPPHVLAHVRREQRHRLRRLLATAASPRSPLFPGAIRPDRAGS